MKVWVVLSINMSTDATTVHGVYASEEDAIKASRVIDRDTNTYNHEFRGSIEECEMELEEEDND